jgi:3-mercaptopyruvate sulfurtransferase SseA
MKKSVRWCPSVARARGAAFGAAACTALLLAGCVGSENEIGAGGVITDASGTPTILAVNTPAQISQRSAENYDDNVNGLISGATLQRWIDDWEANRPPGITGRLVILQVSDGPEGAAYISPKPLEGVVTYSIDPGRLTQTRSNGIMNVVTMVPDGSNLDAFLKDFGIDPTRDMVVCAMGAGGTSHAMRQGRCWYMLRYWGVARTNLAILNGGASHPAVMDAAYLGDVATCDEKLSPACLPKSGYVSVRHLAEDNTALQATLEDLIAVAEGRWEAFVWDARGGTEYTAQLRDNGTVDFRNSGPQQGHPNGAALLPYLSLLEAEDGSYRFKDKAVLDAYMNGEVVDGAAFERYDAGSLIPLGIGGAYRSGQTVITYCETTMRAMITGIASGVILGLPTRFYDGAMYEWNSMAGGVQNKYGEFILPADSSWRTDRTDRSHFVYNSPENIAAREVDNPYAERSNAIIAADKAYKSASGTDGGSGGGIALPVNPCGG